MAAKLPVRRRRPPGGSSQEARPAGLPAVPADRSQVWQLYRDGVTPSCLKVFGTCRAQFAVQYAQGWTPIDPSLPLEFGNYFHWIMEQAYKGTDKPSVSQLAQWAKDYEQAWAAWSPKGAAGWADKAREEKRQLCLGMVEATLPAYFKRWGSQDFRCAWAFTEKEFSVPSGLRLSDDPAEPTITLRGKMDGAFRDGKGRLWLFDTKTKGDWIDGDLAEMLPVDLQMFFYAYALGRMTGERVHGVRYNVVRRSQLRQGKNETISDFCGRIAEDAGKRPDHYFVRLDMHLDAVDVQLWRDRQLAPMLRDLQLWYHGGPHWMNGEALKWGNRKCDAWPILTCGDYSRHYQRERPFPELSY